MKHSKLLILPLAFSFLLAGCGKNIPTEPISYGKLEDTTTKLYNENKTLSDTKFEPYEASGKCLMTTTTTNADGNSLKTNFSYSFDFKNDLTTLLLNETTKVSIEEKVDGKTEKIKTTETNKLALNHISDEKQQLYIFKSVESNASGEANKISNSGKVIIDSDGSSNVDTLDGNITILLKNNYRKYSNELLKKFKDLVEADQYNEYATFAYGEKDSFKRFVINEKTEGIDTICTLDFKNDLVTSLVITSDNRIKEPDGTKTILNIDISTSINKLNKKLTFPDDKKAVEISPYDGLNVLKEIKFYNFSTN